VWPLTPAPWIRLPVAIKLENGTTYTLLKRAGEGGFGTVSGGLGAGSFDTKP